MIRAPHVFLHADDVYVHIPVELQLPARSGASWMMRDAPALELSTRDAESLAAAHANKLLLKVKSINHLDLLQVSAPGKA